MGKFRDAFNIAFKWIKKMSCGTHIGTEAYEWALITALETAVYLNDFTSIEALLPLAILLQKQLKPLKNNLKDSIVIAERVIHAKNTEPAYI
jgi:hypothetical protein